MRHPLSLRTRFLCLLFAAALLSAGSSFGRRQPHEIASEHAAVLLAQLETISPREGSFSPDLYATAYAELSRDLAELYIAADRLTRANDLDIPFWIVRLCDSEMACGPVGPYVLPMNGYLLDMMQRDRGAVAFAIAHDMAIDILQQEARLQAFVEQKVEARLNEVEKGRLDMESLVLEILESGEFQQFRLEREFEADALAYEYLVKAGFDWQGGVRALEAIEDIHSRACKCDFYRQRLRAYLSLPIESPLSPLEARTGRLLLETTDPLPYELQRDGNSIRIIPSGNDVWN